MRGGSGAGALRRVTEAASPVPTPMAAAEGIRPRKESSFTGDVLKLVSGTTIAQGIGVLATPFLTRMYGPEAFGTLALFTSITGIIGVVACLRYELAIMLPETDEEAANLLAVSLLSVVGVTLLTIPAVTWGRGLLARLLNAPELAMYLWAVPVAVFSGGVFQALSYWSSRQRAFGRLSVAKVANTGSLHAIKLAGGFTGRAGVALLIGATVIGPLIGSMALARAILRRPSQRLWGLVSARAVRDLARYYRRFPLIDTGSALLNTISWQVPVLVLGSFFPVAVVGQYSLGMRVVQLPMSLVGAAVGQVFFQRASLARSKGTMPLVLESAIRKLVLVALLPMAIVAVWGPGLFSTVFGPEWKEAGVYAQILALGQFVQFVSSPLSTVVTVYQRLTFGLTMSVLNLGLRFLSLAVGGASGSPELALALFSVSVFASSAYLLWRILGLSGAPTCDRRRVMWSLASPVVMLTSLILSALWSPLPRSALGALLGLFLLCVYSRPAGIALRSTWRRTLRLRRRYGDE